MYRILFLIITLELLGCSRNKIQDDKQVCTTLCTKTYKSEKFGVTIYHSDNWSPYEFFGQNIGMEYRGTHQFERRYDAEIVITFFERGLDESEFYDIYTNNETRQAIAESLGGAMESKTFDKGTTDFANKTWRTLGIDEKGLFEGESYVSKKMNYLWYSPNRQIAITVKVKGPGKIGELDKEVECILSKLEFQDLIAYNMNYS